ncbi:MAG: Kiwa anti-phage protein KwaB-like domain-containing protein [Dermatophilaceae bacterium]
MNQSVTVDGTLHLVVAWTSGKSYQARMIKVSGPVADALRTHAADAAARLQDGTPYAPDADLEDNSHMEADRDESLDTLLLDEISKGTSLDLATAEELRTKPLICHALVIAQQQRTTLFVRKRSPIQLAKKSLVAFLVHDRLDELESPLFAFDNRYDAIITDDRIFVLDKKAFEGLFKSSPAVLEKTTEWVCEVGQHVPFSKGSEEKLDAILKRNSVHRNKFLALKGRAYLQSVTPDVLRAEMSRHNLDPADLMDGDFLRVTDQNVKHILRLLNEDLFQGGFSHQAYAASTKRAL